MEPDLADLLAAWLGLETEIEIRPERREDRCWPGSAVDESVPPLVRRRDPDAGDAQDRAVARVALAPARGRAGLELGAIRPAPESLEDRVVGRLDGQGRRRFRPTPLAIQLGSRSPRRRSWSRPSLGAMASWPKRPRSWPRGGIQDRDGPPALSPGSTPRPAWRWWSGWTGRSRKGRRRAGLPLREGDVLAAGPVPVRVGPGDPVDAHRRGPRRGGAGGRRADLR